VQNYIDILVDKGYKVAICEQMEDPKLAKGMVKREVIQLVTPGTTLERGAEQAKTNNYLTALTQSNQQYGFAYADLSTGELKTSVLTTNDALVNELTSLQTKEIVVDASVGDDLRGQIKSLGILVSEQNNVTPQAELSYLTQDLTVELEKQVVERLLMYITVTQKRSLAGVSDLKLNIGFSATDPAQTVQATLIQQQLKKAGITVTLEGGDGTAIFSELKKPGSTKYNLFLGGYIMGNDPDLYAALFKTGGSSNYFQTNNAKTDQLFDKAAVETDPTKRKALYDQLQKEVADDARIYPIVDNKKILAVNNRIANVKKSK